MNRVFDASSIFEIAKRGDSSPLVDGYALTHTSYELGNILLKHTTLTHTLTMRETEDMRHVLDRMLQTMTLYSPDGIDQETLKMAVELHLSYYDASYLCAAKELKAELITEDVRLVKAATSVGIPSCSKATL